MRNRGDAYFRVADTKKVWQMICHTFKLILNVLGGCCRVAVDILLFTNVQSSSLLRLSIVPYWANRECTSKQIYY